MSSQEWIEASGDSIDDAVGKALAELGADEDDVVIEVLNTPRGGLLGLGSRQAKVRIRRRELEGASSTAQSPPAAAAPRSLDKSVEQTSERVEASDESDAGGAERQSAPMDE